MTPKRLLYNEDGATLDEIVFDGFVHLEQMDDNAYYLGVGDSQFYLRAERGKLIVTEGDISRRDFPVIERHPTKAEFAADPERYTVSVRDDRTDKERTSERAAFLATLDGKGWAKLTGWQRDKYQRRARREMATR